MRLWSRCSGCSSQKLMAPRIWCPLRATARHASPAYAFAMATWAAASPPLSRFHAAARTVEEPSPRPDRTRPERGGEHWVTRKVSTVGVVCVGYQQVCIGQSYAGSACDVLVTDGTLQYWVGNELVKTVARQTKGEIRKKHADGTAPSRVGSAAK